MWKFASSLIEKFSGLTPLKAFFKYVFQRLSDDFLDHEPNIQFKKGQLELLNLPLSAQKINKTFLLASPYIMHSGVIKKLKITLPNLTQITSKSIEVQVSGLELVFYPNKQFLQKFNIKMKQLKENLKFYDYDDKVRETIKFKQDESLDFFKEITKQILTNIKVKVNNISVKVFMNTPSQNKNNPKPQFYSMLRIPSILVKRCEVQQQSETQQSQKYMLKIHQISTHLLRQDMKFPQYGNIDVDQSYFPFGYPTVNHPSTIMLIGNNSLKQDFQSIQITLGIKKSIKTKIKKFDIIGSIPNIQVMFEPFQIKVLQKFINQLNEFKKLYDFSLQQLQRQDSELYGKVAEVPQLKQSFMKSAVDLNVSLDIFSSIAMTFQQEVQPKAQIKQTKRMSYFQSLMQPNNRRMKQLKQGLNQFTNQVDRQTKAKLQEDINTRFQSLITSNIKIGTFRIYCLKYNSQSSLRDYARIWTQYQNKQPILINQHIPSGYLLFNIKQIEVNLEDKEKINLSIKQIILLNVKLTQTKEQTISDQRQSSDIFHSFQQDQNYKLPELNDLQTQTGNKHGLKDLVSFSKTTQQHFCANYVFWMTPQDPPKMSQTTSGFIHCLNSQQHKNIINNGLYLQILKFGQRNSSICLKIQKIGVLIDSEFMKDLTNIVYPLFSYRKLIHNINFKRQQLNSIAQSTSSKHNNVSSIPLNLHHSNYSYNVASQQSQYDDILQPPNLVKQPSTKLPDFDISISNIWVGFTDYFETTQNLISQQKNKIKDSDSFCSKCFCQYNHECISAQVKQLRIVQQGVKKVFFKGVYVWLSSLSNKTSNNKVMIIGLSDITGYNRLYYQKLKIKIHTQQKIKLHLPYVKVSIKKNDCLRVLKMAQKIGFAYKSISQYQKYLSNQFKKIDLTNTHYDIKNKKQITAVTDFSIVIHIQNISINILDVQVYGYNIFISHDNKKTTFKLDDIIILHSNKLQPLLKDVPINHKANLRYFNKQIQTSTIILRLNCPENKQFPLFTNQMKGKDFFKKLQSHNFTFELELFQNLENDQKQTNSKMFGRMTKKKQQLQTIQEQQKYQTISIHTKQSLIIRLCQLKNLLYLKQDILTIQSQIQTSKLYQLFNTPTKQLHQNDFEEAPKRKTIINVGLKQVSFDIFPYQDLKQSQSILSSTRSYFTLQSILIHVQSSEKLSFLNEHLVSNIINLQIKKSELYFLYFDDTDVFKNPSLLVQSDLINYGFKRIVFFATITVNILHELEIKTSQTIIQLGLKFDSIEGQLSSMSTVYLQHHIDTLIRMGDSISSKITQTKQKQQQIEIDELSDSDDDALYFDDNISNKIIQQINMQQSQFKSRTTQFLKQIPDNVISLISLKQLEIKRISFSIFSGDDFCFKQSGQQIITQQTILQLNDNNEVVFKQQIPEGQIQKRKRFRTKNIDKFTNLRFIAEDILLQLHKCKIKKQMTPELNIKAILKIRTINAIVNKTGKDIFYLLKTSDKLSIVFEMVANKIKVNTFLPHNIQVGYTSNLNFLGEERKQAEDHLQQMSYLVLLEQQNTSIQSNGVIYQLFANVSKTRLIVNLQMIGIKFLNNQNIQTSQLFFHSKLCKNKQQDNTKVITDWIKDTLLNNMGSIFVNTFFNVFSKAIWFIISFLKYSILFPSKMFRTLKKN